MPFEETCNAVNDEPASKEMKSHFSGTIHLEMIGPKSLPWMKKEAELQPGQEAGRDCWVVSNVLRNFIIQLNKKRSQEQLENFSCGFRHIFIHPIIHCVLQRLQVCLFISTYGFIHSPRDLWRASLLLFFYWPLSPVCNAAPSN